jgi:hypothetical protein
LGQQLIAPGTAVTGQNAETLKEAGYDEAGPLVRQLASGNLGSGQ